MNIDPEIMASWARSRFAAWLRARGLGNRLRETCSGVLPYGGPKSVQFIKYEYIAPEGLPGLYPETFDTETLYHGTYAPCLARILATQRFLESDESNGLGMENHTGVPAVFAAETLDHAMRYAFPSTMLHDNIYYGVLFELQVLRSGIRSRAKGEVRLSNRDVRIAKVYLLLNLNIEKGGCKMPEWRDELELLPDVLVARRSASVAGHGELCAAPLRRTAWHNEDI